MAPTSLAPVLSAHWDAARSWTLATYEEQTSPLLDYYETSHRLRRVDGTRQHGGRAGAPRSRRRPAAQRRTMS